MSLGPGSEDHLTPAAQRALDESHLVVGYRTYVDLIKPILGDQEVVATGMRQELERVRVALDRGCRRIGNIVVPLDAHPFVVVPRDQVLHQKSSR